MPIADSHHNLLHLVKYSILALDLSSSCTESLKSRCIPRRFGGNLKQVTAPAHKTQDTGLEAYCQPELA
ncbi:hypothetical protein L208DRAFT_1408532 [Tricholoma matsutake]|nr:hypothetical protein L208DRAFT_1408532 [Tricholoma matsutake 945]